MALLQNITLNSQYPFRMSGATAVNTETGKMLSQIGPGHGRQYTRFLGGLPTASALPSGYNPGIFMPLRHQQISSYREADFNVAATAAGLRGYPIIASSSLSVSAGADALPLDDTPRSPAASASFAISVADAMGQLISSGVGLGSLSIYTNTPLMTASLSATGVTSFSFTTNYPLLMGEASIIGGASLSFSLIASMLPTDDSVRNNEASAFFSFSGFVTPYATGSLAGTAFLAGGEIDEFEVLGRMEYDFAVHIHATNGQPGTTSPIGTRGTPVNNITDALTIARSLNLNDIVFLSDYTVQSGDDVTKYKLLSNDWRVLTIEPGTITTDTVFEKLSIYGELSGTWNVFIDCWVYNVTNFLGWVRGGSIERVELAPYIDPDPFSLGSSYFDHLVPMYANATSVLVMNTGVSVSLTDCTDIVTIEEAIDGTIVNVSLDGGKIIIDSSCVGGEIIISGVGNCENNSLLAIDDSGLVNSSSSWKASAADNNTAGTMGNKLNTASSGGVDLDALAEAVWEYER